MARFFTATARATGIPAPYWRPRWPYQGDRVNERRSSLSRISPFLLSYAHPGKGRYILSSRRRERSAILFGWEFGDCPSAIARKARVFHTFLLVFASRVSFSRATRENARERKRDGVVAARISSGILHNTYFMRDVARGNSKRETIRDSLRRRGELTTTQSAFSKIKREYLRWLCTVEIHPKGNDSSHSNFAIASPQFLPWSFKALLKHTYGVSIRTMSREIDKEQRYQWKRTVDSNN